MMERHTGILPPKKEKKKSPAAGYNGPSLEGAEKVSSISIDLELAKTCLEARLGRSEHWRTLWSKRDKWGKSQTHTNCIPTSLPPVLCHPPRHLQEKDGDKPASLAWPAPTVQTTKLLHEIKTSSRALKTSWGSCGSLFFAHLQGPSRSICKINS